MKSNIENLDVIYEDNHLIAINKRCGDIVQGDQTGDQPLSEIVKAFLKKKYDKPGEVFLGVIHRLDRPTSGLVLFAKTSKALSRMNELFRTRDLDKEYHALVSKGDYPSQGRLKNYLRKNPKNNKSYVVTKESKDAKLAILSYKSLLRLDRYEKLSIKLETGRHHQIRCQLAHIGAQIKGDLKYGFPRSNKDLGISLHSRKITFIHPVKKEALTLIAPYPSSEKLWNLK